MRRSAFTLVELLAGTAVFAVLAGLLFVGGRAAIASAKTRSCAANLAQIGTGLALYAHDNDDRYPPYTFMGIGNAPARPKAFKAALAAYRVADAQFYCPLDPFARTAHPSEFATHADASYEMSIDYTNHGRFADVGFVFTPTGLADPTRVNVFDDMSEIATDDEGKRTRSGPHGDRYNVLRADGSVANLPIVQP